MTVDLDTSFVIGQTPLDCDSLVRASRNLKKFSLSPERKQAVKQARELVDEMLDGDIPVYGVNTGVGSQKDCRIDKDQMASFNRKLIRAHGTRVPGETIDPKIVRAMMIVQIHELSLGYSGVSPELIELMLELACSDELPTIDAAGSVSASDLVPLSQLSNWILSQPKASKLGLPKAKDALAMINLNGLGLAAGAHYIVELSELMHGFDVSAALTMEGFRCNLDAISEPVNSVHVRPGQSMVAGRMRSLLKESRLWKEGENRFLQDPLSFRNVSQVHGAAHEFADWLRKIWDEELQGCVINPLVNIGPKPAYSHGNMDTTRMTLALDAMRLALAKMADLVGERTCKQQWPAFTGLPIGLAEEDCASSGVQFLNLSHINSSLITLVKMAANPVLLHPVGQVADGVEDTASNAVHAINELKRQMDACWTIVTLEAIIAVWAIDCRNITPSQLGIGVEKIYQAVRPLLPIGREGEDVFDVASVVEHFRKANLELFNSTKTADNTI